jgi:hypothetical protein
LQSPILSYGLILLVESSGQSGQSYASLWFRPLETGTTVGFVWKTISAKSLAISNVADGRDAVKAAFCNLAIVSGEANQPRTVSAITLGSGLYVPNPDSST